MRRDVSTHRIDTSRTQRMPAAGIDAPAPQCVAPCSPSAARGTKVFGARFVNVAPDVRRHERCLHTRRGASS
jgi:hypothetical protein